MLQAVIGTLPHSFHFLPIALCVFLSLGLDLDEYVNVCRKPHNNVDAATTFQIGLETIMMDFYFYKDAPNTITIPIFVDCKNAKSQKVRLLIQFVINKRRAEDEMSPAFLTS